jgi:hypothetical protein
VLISGEILPLFDLRLLRKGTDTHTNRKRRGGGAWQFTEGCENKGTGRLARDRVPVRGRVDAEWPEHGVADVVAVLTRWWRRPGGGVATAR